MPRALVGNAADPAQVKHAGRASKRALADRATRIAGQLSTYEGRQFVWEELQAHHVFSPIIADSPTIFVLAGAHNEGLRLYAECVQHADLFLLMQREGHLREIQQDRATDAAHTTAATEGAPV